MGNRFQHGKPKKLNPDQVRRLKEAISQGYTQRAMATRFGVSCEALRDYLGLKRNRRKNGT
jgi:hypothetical protein